MSEQRSNGRGLVVPAREEILEPVDRELARVGGVAYPLDERVARGVITVRHEYAEPPVVAPPVEPSVSKVIPLGLVVLAACILVFACYAAWHTWAGPQLLPVKPGNSVDLVGPSRGDSR